VLKISQWVYFSHSKPEGNDPLVEFLQDKEFLLLGQKKITFPPKNFFGSCLFYFERKIKGAVFCDDGLRSKVFRKIDGVGQVLKLLIIIKEPFFNRKES